MSALPQAKETAKSGARRPGSGPRGSPGKRAGGPARCCRARTSGSLLTLPRPCPALRKDSCLFSKHIRYLWGDKGTFQRENDKTRQDMHIKRYRKGDGSLSNGLFGWETFPETDSCRRTGFILEEAAGHHEQHRQEVAMLSGRRGGARPGPDFLLGARSGGA